MNWTCPHCQRKLAASEPPPSGNAPEGWFYTLCGQCQGRSIVCASTGEALRIRKIEPRIEAMPVASPIEIPPPPAERADARLRPPWNPSLKVAAFSVPLIFFVVGTGAYLLDQRRESLARALMARDIAAQVVERETPEPDPASATSKTLAGTVTSDSGTFPPSDPRSAVRKVRSTDLAGSRGATGSSDTTGQARAVTSDRLKSSAASVVSVANQTADESLEVQARDRSASLHSGPGSEYAILGVADPDDRYAVLEMTPHWFKIPLGEAGQVAWVHRRDVDVRVGSDKEIDHD